jgi:DNA-directed RNA polymerase subunit RPC12/RpoP
MFNNTCFVCGKKFKLLEMNNDGTVEGDTDLFCPYCNSDNVQPLGQHHKNFSVGKAAAGAVIAGGVGIAAGLLGKNTKQTDFICLDCGKQFKR